ncbi:site-specific DNA-methyltransferase [Micromonospora aurantiaca (nom. illeg.)]|uniref:site-specific DNA-methyltransferase n=1 Tax=Micromonospora aurantiaca (nom. illeg.) TaxID=47850 RepID=UPI00369448A0
MTVEKLKMHSPDLTQRNIDRIAELFPSVVTEKLDDAGNPVRALDFDLLRQELSEQIVIVEGAQERYQLDWPGKRAAAFAANAPVAKTLRPVREESVEFDTTKNLFIEGDNLDALKLLQESYLGKVKLIYIDPPYNTGGDLIYNDDFAESTTAFLERSGQRTRQGERLVANPNSNGRFHSDWLDMMYPRLKLARNLLADDGVIFVSIDDSESANLRALLDEVFGRQNFLDTIAVEMSTTSGPKTVNAQQGTIVKNVEFVHVYKRSPAFDRIQHTPLLDGVDDFDTHYSIWLHDDGRLGALGDVMLADERVGADIRRFNLAGKSGFSVSSMDKLWALSEPAVKFIHANLERIARIDRPPVSAHGRSTAVGRWERFEVDHRTYLLTTLQNGSLQALIPLSLNYRMSDDYKPRFGRTVIRGDLWKGFHQDMGNVGKEGGIAFSNGKKPVRLIKQLMRWANNTRNGIVLDFFAGSGTTAQAVMEANADDGGNRRFILVQLDEVPDPRSAVASPGFGTIAALSRERIRRAATQISHKLDISSQPVDLGFRALAVGTTNMADVLRTPDASDQAALLDTVDSVKPDRTGEDLLFQVLLDWGLDLSLPISREMIDGHEVFTVDDDALIACFANDVTPAVVAAMAARHPLRAVFKDGGFADDASRINAEQVFREVSPITEMRAI